MEAIHEENHLSRIGPLLGDIGKRTAILGRSAFGLICADRPMAAFGGAGFPVNEEATWL